MIYCLLAVFSKEQAGADYYAAAQFISPVALTVNGVFAVAAIHQTQESLDEAIKLVERHGGQYRIQTVLMNEPTAKRLTPFDPINPSLAAKIAQGYTDLGFYLYHHTDYNHRRPTLLNTYETVDLAIQAAKEHYGKDFTAVDTRAATVYVHLGAEDRILYTIEPINPSIQIGEPPALNWDFIQKDQS